MMILNGPKEFGHKVSKTCLLEPQGKPTTECNKSKKDFSDHKALIHTFRTLWVDLTDYKRFF
jgi:hypothetical protein